MRAWLRRFCTGDLFDPEFRRNIIDTFINCIYLYDDRIIIFYNIKGGKQVSFVDLAESLDNESESSGSDLNANAPPQEKPLIPLESRVLFLYFFITVFRALTADLTATSFYPVF